MTQIMFYSGLIIAALTLLYFSLDIVIWMLYFMANLL